MKRLKSNKTLNEYHCETCVAPKMSITCENNNSNHFLPWQFILSHVSLSRSTSFFFHRSGFFLKETKRKWFVSGSLTHLQNIVTKWRIQMYFCVLFCFYFHSSLHLFVILGCNCRRAGYIHLRAKWNVYFFLQFLLVVFESLHSNLKSQKVYLFIKRKKIIDDFNLKFI